VGSLRIRLVSALAPLAQDVVITGHDRAEACAMVFLSPQARELPPETLRTRIGQALGNLRREGGGSSQSIARALVLDEPPSVDAGEITDKGYVNQRAVQARRADAVLRLYNEPYDAQVIHPS
jgi:feruloyl-CoA synthase